MEQETRTFKPRGPDRRKVDVGPPPGMAERRRLPDRRTTIDHMHLAEISIQEFERWKPLDAPTS